MTDSLNRKPLSPEEFKIRVKRLLEIYPYGRISSAWRSEGYNQQVGGHPESKHLFSPLQPIALDLVWPGLEYQVANISRAAGVLGLWFVYHDKGSGPHLHTQALAPGPIPDWYRTQYNISKDTL